MSEEKSRILNAGSLAIENILKNFLFHLQIIFYNFDLSIISFPPDTMVSLFAIAMSFPFCSKSFIDFVLFFSKKTSPFVFRISISAKVNNYCISRYNHTSTKVILT